MKQTKNYQLSQWEKEDRIRMEDFNADNAKVDAAVKAVEGKVEAVDGRLSSEVGRLEGRDHFTLLREVVVTAAAEQLDIDVADLDWSQWEFVAVICQGLYDVKVLCNNSGDNAASGQNGQSVYKVLCQLRDGNGVLLFYPAKNQDATVACLNLNRETGWGNYGNFLSYKGIRTFNFVGDCQPGARVRILGIR